MQNIKNAANYVGDSVKQGASKTSYETNKAIAKDSNAPAGTRMRAAGDAVGDKIDEKQNKTSANLNKEAAKH